MLEFMSQKRCSNYRARTSVSPPTKAERTNVVVLWRFSFVIAVFIVDAVVGVIGIHVSIRRSRVSQVLVDDVIVVVVGTSPVVVVRHAHGGRANFAVVHLSSSVAVSTAAVVAARGRRSTPAAAVIPRRHCADCEIRLLERRSGRSVSRRCHCRRSSSRKERIAGERRHVVQGGGGGSGGGGRRRRHHHHSARWSLLLQLMKMELLRLGQSELATSSGVVARTDVSSHMLLQNERVGELLVAHSAGVKCTHGRLGTVHTHVSLEITLGGERSSADLAAKRPFSGVRAIVHLQSALAAQRSQADGALVRVGQLLVDAAHQLLHFARLR